MPVPIRLCPANRQLHVLHRRNWDLHHCDSTCQASSTPHIYSRHLHSYATITEIVQHFGSIEAVTGDTTPGSAPCMTNVSSPDFVPRLFRGQRPHNAHSFRRAMRITLAWMNLSKHSQVM